MFIRSAKHPFGRILSPFMARALVVALYVLYPLGCILQLAPDHTSQGLSLNILGLALVVAAVGAFFVLAGSSVQRLTQEPAAVLDERELSERNRAAYLAHSIFAGIVMLGLIYLMLSQDLAESGKLDLWRPSTGEHWNALFFACGMLAMTLPAAILAFDKQLPEAED